MSVHWLDVVLEEEGEGSGGQTLMGECEGYNEKESEEVLSGYKQLFSGVPGNTRVVEMEINTREHTPIRQSPYTVPLGLRDKVSKEPEALQQAGIIKRLDSPWASPLVPV